jgi:hypothetical protein
MMLFFFFLKFLEVFIGDWLNLIYLMMLLDNMLRDGLLSSNRWIMTISDTVLIIRLDGSVSKI